MEGCLGTQKDTEPDRRRASAHGCPLEEGAGHRGRRGRVAAGGSAACVHHGADHAADPRNQRVPAPHEEGTRLRLRTRGRARGGQPQGAPAPGESLLWRLARTAGHKPSGRRTDRPERTAANQEDDRGERARREEMTHLNFAMTTLLNGIWQGALLAAAMWIALKLFPRVNPTTRFTVLWLTLLAVAMLPVGPLALTEPTTSLPHASAPIAATHTA